VYKTKNKKQKTNNIGCSLFVQKAHRSEIRFNLVMNGKIRHLIKSWGRLALIPTDAMDLLEKMFQPNAEGLSYIYTHTHTYTHTCTHSKTMYMYPMEILPSQNRIPNVVDMAIMKNMTTCTDLVSADRYSLQRHNAVLQTQQRAKSRGPPPGLAPTPTPTTT